MVAKFNGTVTKTGVVVADKFLAPIRHSKDTLDNHVFWHGPAAGWNVWHISVPAHFEW